MMFDLSCKKAATVDIGSGDVRTTQVDQGTLG